MTEQKKFVIPEDIQKALTSIAKGAKLDNVTSLLQEMKQIMTDDETIKAMPEDALEHKIRFAFGLLARRYTASGTIPAYIKPTVKPRPKLSKKGKHYGDLIALVRVLEKDKEGKIIIGDTKLGVGTLFGKSAENMKNLDPTKIYKADMYIEDANATINNTKVEGYSLSGNDITFTETTETTFPTNEDFYKEYFAPKEKDLKIPLTELDLNIATKDNDMDIRIIYGFVTSPPTEGNSAKIGEFCRYEISDNNILESGIRGENMVIFVHPSEPVYEPGSRLAFITLIEKFNDITRTTVYMIVPIDARIMKIKPKPVGGTEQKESVDVASLGATGDNFVL